VGSWISKPESVEQPAEMRRRENVRNRKIGVYFIERYKIGGYRFRIYLRSAKPETAVEAAVQVKIYPIIEDRN
jgi:hypothetical protein